ncbi:hypothetical protein DPMN_043548 [Dreissena polymorpha]|uniref:Uncharacterized protein n=1 Tax=Dreissena polymorpha TaxID=45954 RepID=A0A9D4HY23_DREPO|nr:hypothetical protein DPMN_043548 [Dreissena polymorpha]
MHRPPSGPVFISLSATFGPIRDSAIAKVLEEGIKLAGLEGQGYSAKSFRPTVVTTAVENHVDRKVGRWNNSEVFFAHYVHSKPPQDFTAGLLNHESC